MYTLICIGQCKNWNTVLMEGKMYDVVGYLKIKTNRKLKY